MSPPAASAAAEAEDGGGPRLDHAAQGFHRPRLRLRHLEDDAALLDQAGVAAVAEVEDRGHEVEEVLLQARRGFEHAPIVARTYTPRGA